MLQFNQFVLNVDTEVIIFKGEFEELDVDGMLTPFFASSSNSESIDPFADLTFSYAQSLRMVDSMFFESIAIPCLKASPSMEVSPELIRAALRISMEFRATNLKKIVFFSSVQSCIERYQETIQALLRGT